jgi:hypothetical protein
MPYFSNNPFSLAIMSGAESVRAMNPSLALVVSGASAALTLGVEVAVASGLAFVVASVVLGASPPPEQAFRAIALTVESPAVVKNLRRENVLIDFLNIN